MNRLPRKVTPPRQSFPCYPPNCWNELGAAERGTITGLFTVLVDGDDLMDPIADAARSVLDGHIVLARRLASLNHYPAIDILQSVSRVMPDVVDEQQLRLAQEAREVLAVYQEAEDLINVGGAYVAGSNPAIDRARSLIDPLRAFSARVWMKPSLWPKRGSY